MQSDAKYSVIIPVYNAETTLKRCIDSLVLQNRRDVQIIVINDGSTDSSAEILAAYGTITVITQENKGVSVARNRGLEAACGKYVLFLDSDDYVSRDYFIKLDNMDENCDICYFQRRFVGGSQLDEEALFQKINTCSTWIKKMDILLSSREIMQLYNKRFKREIFTKHNLQFIECLYSSEDFNFCLAYSLHCKDIKMYRDKIYFNDLSNQESLSRKARKDLTEQLVCGFHYAAVSIQQSDRTWEEQKSLLTELDYLYAKCVCSCIAETFKFGKSGYFQNRTKYKFICENFRTRIGGSGYKNITHRGLRKLMDYQIVYPIYLLTWLMKGNNNSR